MPAPIFLYAANNLITNLSQRTSGNNLKPLINKNGDEATFESCYRTTDEELAPLSHKFVMTIDLAKSFFIHCFLVVQDLYGGKIPSDHLVSAKEWLHDYDVHIGDSADYTENPKCTGSPFMGLTDSNSYLSG